MSKEAFSRAGRVVWALELDGEELEADADGAQLLGERRELDAAAEPLVLVHDDRDGGPGRADLAGQSDSLAELGLGDSAGGDLLGEDPRDASCFQGVGLVSSDWRTVEARALADPHVPRRRGADRRGPGQLGPGRARLAERRDRDGEGLRQAGHEAEPGGPEDQQRGEVCDLFSTACPFSARRPGCGLNGPCLRITTFRSA
jgi:hypothetical protein